MKTLLTVGFWLSLILVSGCDGGAPDRDGQATQVAQFDAVDHFARSGGDLDLRPWFPDSTPKTESGWEELVFRARAQGLGDLSDLDRHAVLAGAMTAFLMTVEETRVDVFVGDTSVGSIATLRGKDQLGYFVTTLAEESRIAAYDVRYPAPARPNQAAPSALMTRLVNGTVDGNTREIFRDVSGWRCERKAVDSNSDEALRQGLIEFYATIVLGDVKAAQSGPDWQIEAAGPFGDVVVVLDANSLWPKAWEYVDSIDEGEPPTRYVLKSVNSAQPLDFPIGIKCG